MFRFVFNQIGVITNPIGVIKNMEYSCISGWLETKTDLNSKILAIDLVIDSMIGKLADYAAGPNTDINTYELNDGQVRIRTQYRSIEDVQKAISAMERMKNLYINKLNGRSVVLQDRSTFKGPGFGWGY